MKAKIPKVARSTGWRGGGRSIPPEVQNIRSTMSTAELLHPSIFEKEKFKFQQCSNTKEARGRSWDINVAQIDEHNKCIINTLQPITTKLLNYQFVESRQLSTRMAIQKPQARTAGSQSYFMNTKDDDLLRNPFLTMTPGSETGSAFQPVSPSSIKRKDKTSIRHATKNANQVEYESPCDTTQTMSLQSLEQPQSSSTPYERQKKEGMYWGMTTTFKNHIKQIKSNFPIALKSMKLIRTSSNNKSTIDLSDLAVATISLMPRHGGGIASGRMPFQRVRTSVMLHMIQECKNSSWDPRVTEEMVDAKSGKVSIAKLNTLLRNCIAEDDTCFVEKSQEAVKIAKNTLEVRAWAQIIVFLTYHFLIILSR